MKKSYNKAFTLVELLAVIVILAIILVIAVPKIMDVINSSKKSTLETSVKMIASAAEKTKMQNAVLGKEDATITCDSVAKLSSNDYENCTIKFDGNTAKVTVKGKGKFEGLNVCGGTKSNATAQKEECTTDGKYFTYKKLFDEDDLITTLVEVKDASKCMAYLSENFCSSLDEKCDEEVEFVCLRLDYDNIITSFVENGHIPSTDYEKAGLDVKKNSIVVVDDADKCTVYLNERDCASRIDERKTSCEDYNAQICSGTIDDSVISYRVKKGFILPSDFEEAGLKVFDAQISITSYNSEGGTDVVIPKEIDGHTVVEIGREAFENKGLTSVEIPNTVTSIGSFAFYHNDLTNITIPNGVTIIGDVAFKSNNLTSIIIPSSVTSIGNTAFYNNPLSKVELSNPYIDMGLCAFGVKKNITTHNLPDTYECSDVN